MTPKYIIITLLLLSGILLQPVALAEQSISSWPSLTNHVLLPPDGQKVDAFHMVVIGDSVAWGNGLNDQDKYYYLVADWLQKELNRPIDVAVYAHSGASISGEIGKSIDPNLNSGYPTLMDQANNIQNKDEVDLILVSGGINDVGVFNIINPDIPSDEIAQRAQSTKGTMEILLTYLLDKCNKAKIVVTDYYPIISEDSDTKLIMRAYDLGIFAVNTALNKDTLDGSTAKERLTENSAKFHEGSTTAITNAILDSDDAANHIVLANVNFKPENSYAAKETWLWKFIAPQASMVSILKTDDDQFDYRSSLASDLVDKINAVGHPNRDGAKEYARAIESAINSKGLDWLQNNAISSEAIDTEESVQQAIAIGSTTSMDVGSATPYSIDFDLHNDVGFNDNTIRAEDIVAFIQKKYPNSPMLSETNIGNCFISAGNNINPAFLVALACLEGGFGTLGLAKSHPECHNTFESLGAESYYAAIGAKTPNEFNCGASWCAMGEDVAARFRLSDYYAQGFSTVSQVCAEYKTKPNANAIANLMNELYAFSVSRKGGYSPQMLDTSTPQLSGGSLPVTSLAFGPDGNKLATSAQYGDTSIWDVESGTKLQTLKIYPMGVTALAFSPDGSKMATGIDNDRVIQIWDVASGEELQSIQSVSGTLLVAFSPDGSKLITTGWGGSTSVWDVKRGTQLQNENYEGSDLASIALSSDGSKVATCNRADRTTRIWDVASGAKLRELEHDHPVSFVALNIDGSKLVTYCGPEPELDIWDVETGTKLQEFNLDKDAPLAFSPDGEKIAIGSNDGYTSIWDVASGMKLQTLERSHYCRNPKAIAFSPDGEKIAIGGNDGFTRIWDVTKTTSASKKSGTEDLPSQVVTPVTNQNTTSHKDASEPLKKSPGFAGILSIAALLCIFILCRKD